MICDDQLQAAGVATGRAGDRGEHHERHRVGEHRGADRGGHGAVGRQAHVAHDRVDDERVAGEQRAEQDRGGQAVVDEQPADDAERERDEERQRGEAGGLLAVPGEHAEVELETGDEHQVQQADLAELVQHAGVVAGDAEHVRPDDAAAGEQADQAGDADALDEHRPDDDDDHRDEQLPDGAVRRGEVQRGAWSGLGRRGWSGGHGSLSTITGMRSGIDARVKPVAGERRAASRRRRARGSPASISSSSSSPLAHDDAVALVGDEAGDGVAAPGYSSCRAIVLATSSSAASTVAVGDRLGARLVVVCFERLGRVGSIVVVDEVRLGRARGDAPRLLARAVLRSAISVPVRGQHAGAGRRSRAWRSRRPSPRASVMLTCARARSASSRSPLVDVVERARRPRRASPRSDRRGPGRSRTRSHR